MKEPRPFDKPSAEERVRDRLLLYVSALRLPPRAGLELVARTLASLFPGDEADMGRAMERLGEEAREMNLSLEPDATSFHRAAPPYNRGSMPPARI